MQVSEECLDQIKDAEGYHTALPDGRAKAYLCPAGKWTIGWGATEGVRPGMIWSREQCEAALNAEIDKHEAAVNRLVKKPLTQGQFDCLVSFSYNVGWGALEKSTLLKEVNAGRYESVPTQLLRYTKHTDPKTKKKVDSRGLLNRRLREIRMWKGEHLEAEPPAGPLPQAAVPETTSPVKVAARSHTIWSLATGMFGWLIVKFNDIVSFALDAATNIATFAPLKTMAAEIGLTTTGVGFAVVIAALAYAAQRKLIDGSEGRAG